MDLSDCNKTKNMSKNALPIILVSAADNNAASTIISELIDNEVELEDDSDGRVWRLVNKYYSADVRVCPYPLPAALAPLVEAHVVYLAENECDEATLEARIAHGHDTCAEVRLVAASCGEECAAALPGGRYEVVPLRAAPGPKDGPFPDEAGLPRLRAALHAHVWPGLRRLDRPNVAPTFENGGDSDSWGSSDEEEEGLARVEEFAEALEALSGARDAARAAWDADAAGDASREERLARAEALVAAFCRALGPAADEY